jgi:hypothetical protein
VSDLFRGTLCSRVRCRACRAESITYDQFYDLSLTIPKCVHSACCCAAVDAAAVHGVCVLVVCAARDVAVALVALWCVRQTEMRPRPCRFCRVLGLLCGLFGSSSIRLVDCLYNFCESEPLVGRDQYFCETCKERTNAGRAAHAPCRVPPVVGRHACVA